MSLIQCSICRMNTLSTQSKCQYCGNPLIKMGIWKRKMRKREAYGILLIVTGLALLQLVKSVGLILMFLGIGLVVYGFFQRRVR